jgi:hypothetical protein
VCQCERSKSDLHVHCKSTFCSVAVAVSLACLFSSALLVSQSLEDVKRLLFATIKVAEVFVSPSLLRSFTGLICQVHVVHGRYVFLFLNEVDSTRSNA